MAHSRFGCAFFVLMAHFKLQKNSIFRFFHRKPPIGGKVELYIELIFDLNNRKLTFAALKNSSVNCQIYNY